MNTINRKTEIHWYQLFLSLILVVILASPATSAVIAQDPTPQAQALISEQIEMSTETLSAGIAWGDPDGAHSTYPWPFNVDQMGHAIQSYQNYGSSPYFHHGIDMIAPNGTDVYNYSGGQVVNVENYTPGNDLYWEIAILDPEGYVWQYHHIDKNTIPQLIKDKFNEWKANPTTGGFIPAGTYIGDIVYWTVTSFGYRFNHIHLNILAAGDAYLNTMEFHPLLNDTQVPEILQIGLLDNNTVTSGNTASANYGLYVRARDLFLSPVYYLPPYKTEFSIDGGPWTTVWEFHDLPGGASDTAFVSDFYVVPPTCGNYDCRDFYIDLGFTTAGQRAFPTAPGGHTIQVRVWDYNGNSTSGSFSWTVTNSTAYETTSSGTIPDNGCSTNNRLVRTFNVSQQMVVSDVDLGLNLYHSSRGQLEVTLKAPGDTTATTIVSRVSDSYDNYDVLIDDASNNNINDGNNDSTSSPYYDRTAGPRPGGSLDAFTGKNAQGTWTLSICDGTSRTTGTFYRAKLVLTGSSNNAPAANPQSVTTNEDTPLNIVLTGSDADNDPLTYRVTANPAHGSLSGSAPNLVYTPALNFNGTDSFQFVANDGFSDSAPATVSINVLAVNDAPVANNQAVGTTQDVAVAITLTGSDIDGDALGYQVLSNPVHGTLSGVAPDLLYTPESGYIGEDNFNFVVNDGSVSSAPATVTITVSRTNHQPVADAQSLQTDEDVPAAISLTGSDPDGDPLTYLVTSFPAHGVLSGSAPNLTYTPNLNFNGSDSFTFLVNDGQIDSQAAVVNITVSPVNDAPIANAQSVSVVESGSTAVTLSASDVDGDLLSYWVVVYPLNGSLSGTPPNLIYTPNAGFTGADSFQFAANDGQLDSTPALISITVNPAGPQTVFADDFETNQGWTRNPNGSDNATTGMWERANPEQVDYNGAKQLGTTASGSYDLVTGPLAGSSAGSYDVDSGVTSIRSPNIILPAGKTLQLSLKYYMAHASNSSSSDYLRVKVVGSGTTTVLEELGAANDDDAAWASFTGSLNSYAGQTVYLLIECADASTASLVECGVDDVSITATTPAAALLKDAVDSFSSLALGMLEMNQVIANLADRSKILLMHT